MSNHFHMLATTPRANVDQGMCYLLREVSKEINLQTNRLNHVFGGPYKWSLIQSPLHFAHVYKYIYQNPLRAKMVQAVEHYPFSSLSNGVGRKTFLHIQPPALGFEELIPSEFSERIAWLNTLPKTKHDNALVKAALKRSVFAFPEKRLNECKSSLKTVTL